MEELYSILIKNIPEQNIYLNEPMNKHTSFRIGGSADIFIKINTQEELKYILKVVQNERIPLTIIGNGTNILVRDNGIRGIVAKINIQKFEIETTGEDVIVTLGAGEPLGKVAQNLVKHSIQGFEFASGIPGTIGGAIKMNAGAYGGEFKDIVKDVTYMDAVGNIETIQNNECNFSYRHSLFSNKNYIILEATLMLQKGNINDIKSKMEEYAEGGLDYSGKCYISQSACIEDAREVARLVEERFPKLNGKVEINSIGTTIGSHTGPGTVALFFWGSKRTA